jgi:hypothetical protein
MQINDEEGDKFPIIQKGISHMLIIGKTLSGKSKFLAKYFYENRKYYNYIIVYSCVAKDDQTQGDADYKFTDMLFDDYSPEKIQNIYEVQKKTIKNRPRIGIVFDDCNINYNHDDYLNWLMPKARHYNMNFFFSVQYFSMVSPTIRANCDVVCITTIEGKSNIDQIFNYLSHYVNHDLKLFYELLTLTKSNYDLLLFNKSKKDNDNNIYLYHYNYLEIPYFEIGKKIKK